MESILAGNANAFCKRASAIARDVHEVRIPSDLIEDWQQTFGFG